MRLELVTLDETAVFSGKSSPTQQDFRLNFITNEFLNTLRNENKLLVYLGVDFGEGFKRGVYSCALETTSLAEIVRSLVAEIHYPVGRQEYPMFRIVSWNHAMRAWPDELMNEPARKYHLPNLIVHPGPWRDEEIHPGDIIIIE